MTSLFVVGIKYPVSKEEYSKMLNQKKNLVKRQMYEKYE